jgi:UrcA family protein
MRPQQDDGALPVKTAAPIALAISLLAPAVLAPAAAQAATAADVTTALRVSHADLDLSQPQGAAIMFGRLERASLSVCGASQFSFREVRDEARKSACFHQSMDQAVTSLGAPSVTALYQGQR